MSNLRLVKEFKLESATRIFIATELFSDEFDTYRIEINGKATSASNSILFTLVNDNGEQLGENLYDYAYQQNRSNQAVAENRLQNGDYWSVIMHQTAVWGGATFYLFNPATDGRYTYMVSDSSVFYNAASIRYLHNISVGNMKNTYNASGLKMYGNGGSMDNFTLRCYGIRRD